MMDSREINFPEGLRRLALVSLAFWLVGYALYIRNDLIVFFYYPEGEPGWTCERAFSEKEMLADCLRRVGSSSLYSIFMSIKREEFYFHLAMLLGVPLLVIALYASVVWVGRGLKS